MHAGSFVWADSTAADFASTAVDQFSIKAAGGIRMVGDLTIESEIFCTDCIDSADIAANAVGADEIQAGAVGTSEIADGQVMSADIAPGVLPTIQTSSSKAGFNNINPAVGTVLASNTFTVSKTANVFTSFDFHGLGISPGGNGDLRMKIVTLTLSRSFVDLPTNEWASLGGNWAGTVTPGTFTISVVVGAGSSNVNYCGSDDDLCTLSTMVIEQ